MSDFADMIRDALTAGRPFHPEPGRRALEAAMARIDRRSRSMRWLVGFSLVFMTGLLVLGLYQLVHADHDNTRMISHGVLLAVAGVVGIAFAKLWFLLSQNHLTVMRELKGLEYLVLRDQQAGE